MPELHTLVWFGLLAGHVVALVSGLMAFSKMGPLLQTVSAKDTFNPKAVNQSYLSRHVWGLGVTIPYTLLEIFKILNGQTDASAAQFYALGVTVLYHVNTYKDRRGQA